MGNIIGLITARGGSKRLPGKNIKTLAGKPMIAWTINTAIESKQCSRLITSTEDKKIANVAKIWGAEVLDRPQELAADDTLSIDVALHAAQELKLEPCDYILLLQPTSPLRIAKDILLSVGMMNRYRADAVVSTVKGLQKPNGAIYLNRVSSLKETKSFYPKGNTWWYEMPQDRSLDVDTEWQFKIAELVLKDRERL